jgi:hypothetical protein
VTEKLLDGMPGLGLDQAGFLPFLLDDLLGELPRLMLRSRLEQAGQSLDPASSPAIRLRLWQAALAGHTERVEELAREAWSHEDPAVPADAAHLLYQCLGGPQHAARRRELAARLVSVGDVRTGLLWTCVEQIRAGSPETSLPDLRAALVREPDPRVSLLADRLAALADLRAGHFRVGVTDLHGAVRRWYETGHSPLSAAGDVRQVEAALARLSGSPTDLYWGVEVAAVLGERDFAASAYDALLLYADLPMTAPLDAVCFGSAQQALGVAAVALGDYPRAIDHLTAAVRANLALGHWPALVLTRARLARCWLLHDPRHGAERARRELRLATRDAAGRPFNLPEWQTSADQLLVRRHGPRWELVLGRRRITVDDTRGVRYLAVLNANPGRSIRAADLAAAGPDTSGPGSSPGPASAQPVLDEAAVRAYRERLARLRSEAEPGTAPSFEMEWLRSSLAAASGPGGRRRAFADHDERARIAVGKAIRRAIDQVTRIDPEVGGYLRAVVRTGVRCVFEPL